MIRFVGKSSYTPPKSTEKGHKLAIKAIEKIEPVIKRIDPFLENNSISERWFDKSLKKEHDSLSFNIWIEDNIFYKYPEKREPVIKFLNEIREKINEILKDIGNNTFFFELSWSTYSFDITIRPRRVLVNTKKF